MRNFIKMLRYAPKRTSAVIAILAAAIIVPATLFAWGPGRPTYTIENPADHVTFNSITNNPAHGDERNFMQVREANASNTTYADSISLSPSHEYVVFMYFHNNASSSLNASGVGIAHGAYARAEIPATIAAGSNGTKAVGYVGANNANPGVVWDDISFANNTNSSLALRYVPGSSTIHSWGPVNGQTMSDSIVTSGAPIGYNALNGELPGCEPYAGYVTFRVRAEAPTFTATKQVKISGTTGWHKSIRVSRGNNVEYLITYRNTSNITQNNVFVRDVLPAGVTFTRGTTYVANSTNPNGIKVSDGIITSSGINIGNYAAGGSAYIKFNARVTATDSTLRCGLNTLRNSTTVHNNYGSISDIADVIINKVCVTGDCACNDLTIALVSGNEYRFNGTATARNGAVIRSYTFNFGDGTTRTVTNPNNITHTYSDASANYVARLSVNYVLGGVNRVATGSACEATIATATSTITPGTTVSASSELPVTGPGEDIAALLGLGSMTTAFGYYQASRQRRLMK